MKTPAQYQKNNREEGAETGRMKEHWDCAEHENTKARGPPRKHKKNDTRKSTTGQAITGKDEEAALIFLDRNHGKSHPANLRHRRGP